MPAGVSRDSIEGLDDGRAHQRAVRQRRLSSDRAARGAARACGASIGFCAPADVCYVGSLHDGMNLVAKEFVSARDDERGVLVLSRVHRCGASAGRRVDRESAGDRGRGARARGRAEHGRWRAVAPDAAHAVDHRGVQHLLGGRDRCCRTRRVCGSIAATAPCVRIWDSGFGIRSIKSRSPESRIRRASFTQPARYCARRRSSRSLSCVKSTGLTTCASKPAALRAFVIGGLAVAGHRDEQRSLLGRACAEQLRQLVAVHQRQSEIEQRDIGAEVVGASRARPDRRTPPAYRGRPLRARRRVMPRGVDVVVDDENSPAGAHRRARGRRRRRRRLRGATTRRSPREAHHELAALIRGRRCAPRWCRRAAATRLRTIVKPRPSPPCARSSACRSWVNRSKIVGSISRRCRCRCRGRAARRPRPAAAPVTRICPRGSVYSPAFVSTFTTTCVRRVTSPRTISPGARHVDVKLMMPLLQQRARRSRPPTPRSPPSRRVC